ncbi:hypothetical protein [Oceanicella actignis]|uniref:hypothetical protein n=1 Tax=Oceanicella actignis TaxID=1189325 RepID=UPI0012590C00|nr:hypothetical protein [Oceanicella actignis]TYO91440.1 hypothetical protein LY05_00293 [Oceanicella actignis]
MALCATMEMLAEYVGPKTALKLAEAFGGTDLRVPRRRAGNTWAKLVSALGDEEAARFVHLFSGERIYVPTNADGQREQLRNAIIRELRNGRSPEEVVANVRTIGPVSVRHVRRIARNVRQEIEARQMQFASLPPKK